MQVKYRMVVVPDIHLKRTDPLGVIGKDGVNTRLRDKLNAVGHCVRHAVDSQATHLVFLGDIFETVNPSEKLRKMFWAEVAPAIHKGIQIRIVLGNHDVTGQSHNLASENITAKDSIKVYETGSHTETLPLGGKNLVVCYVPYTSDPQFDTATPIDILFGHLEVEGAVAGPDNAEMRSPIKRTDIPGKLRWLGHIHKFQEFDKGFAYLGSCTCCGFGEVGERKFFGVCEIGGAGELNFKYLEIPQRPMYQVRIEEQDPHNLYLSEAPSEIKTPGVLLQFVFIGTREWLQTLDKKSFKKRFSKAGFVDIKTELIDSDRPQSDSGQIPLEERMRAYAKMKKKNKEVLDAGLELAKMAKELEM